MLSVAHPGVDLEIIGPQQHVGLAAMGIDPQLMPRFDPWRLIGLPCGRFYRVDHDLRKYELVHEPCEDAENQRAEGLGVRCDRNGPEIRFPPVGIGPRARRVHLLRHCCCCAKAEIGNEC